MADFTIKKGDLLPPIEAILKDANGNVVDLTDATEVNFIMQAQDSDTTKINTKAGTPAEIVNALGGQVRYSWVSTDTDTPGLYFAEFEVDWSSVLQTFPNKGFIIVEIVEDLA